MRIILVFILANVLIIEANAADDNFVVVGVGNDSCASYTLAISNDAPETVVKSGRKTYFTVTNAYSQWIYGFISAYNFIQPSGNNQIDIDGNGISIWIKNYCDKNPTASIEIAALALINTHKAKPN